MRPLVISGPSGVGKGTLRKMLIKKHPELCSETISHTTRKPRPGDVDGVDYHFVTETKFLSLLGENAFVEHAFFNGHYYGTSKQTITEKSSHGAIVIIEIEMDGVKQLKADKTIDARYVFIAPPNLEALENRLRARGTESDEKIAGRLAQARLELEYAAIPGVHDKIIVNDGLKRAYKELEHFVFEP